jgi:hypothetical protein
MSFGSTLVEVVTVGLPVLGTLAGGWLVQRSEHQKYRLQQASQREEATQAERRAEREARARLLADVTTTGAAWRRAMSSTTVALVYQRHVALTDLRLDAYSEAHAAFGTAVHVALNSVGPGAVYSALQDPLDVAYEDGFTVLRELVSGETAHVEKTLRSLNDLVGAGLRKVQEAVLREASGKGLDDHPA